MRRKQLAKRVAVAALSATMALSTGVPAFAATVTSVKVDGKDDNVMDSNSTAGKIADVFATIDTTPKGKWGDSAGKRDYIHEHFAVALADAKIFANTSAAYTAISVPDDNTCVVTLEGKQYTVSQTDGAAATTTHEATAKAAEEAAEKQAAATKAVTDALKKLDLTYNNSLTKGQNEKNVKDAAKEALSALDSGLSVGNVIYTDGTNGADSKYTIAISGTFTAGDYKDVTLNVSLDFAPTSKDATVLEDAATALNKYKTESADAATTQDEISEGVQDVLDKAKNDDFDDITFTIENFKKTDDKITADVVLKLGDATKTVKLNKAIDKTGLAGTALNAINSTNLKTVAANNFTTDTDGVATGLDSDALAAAVKKVAEEALRGAGYTNAVANVSITTYEADKDSDNGYAVGSITVTRNGETSAAKIFTINADLNDGSYKYSTADSQGTGIVRDPDVLKKSDNQKIASVVKTLDKALEKDATLGIKNTANKNVPLTKSGVLAQAKATTSKINVLGDEGVDLKYAVSDDGKTVDTSKTDEKAIVVKSYTAPTTEAEGTAVITVNYNIIKDEKTAGSTTASDYVSASHDITLTFPKLSARKTSAIDVKDSTSKIDLTLNATDTTDAKDYFDFNGNSALTWTSSDESVFTVDKDGNLSPVGIGEATLTVAVADNDSVKATKTVKVTGTTAFKDVQNRKAWYYNAISTLAGKKNAKGNAIVQGVAKDEFGISTPITRAQFVTFLYRLADEPAVSTTTKFTDVDTNAYYAKAVAWAAQKGIVYGKTDTIFAPNDTVSRAEAVTMLYRYKGEPDYNSNITTTFSDVARGAYYYDAVQWAAGTVTYGKSATTFAPGDACDRAEGITMIYRAEPQSK